MLAQYHTVSQIFDGSRKHCTTEGRLTKLFGFSVEKYRVLHNANKSYKDKNAENDGFRWIIQDNPSHFRSSDLDFKNSILDLSLRQAKLHYLIRKIHPSRKPS